MNGRKKTGRYIILWVWIISLPFLVSCQLEDRTEKGSGLPDPSGDLPTVTEEYGVGRTVAGHPTNFTYDGGTYEHYYRSMQDRYATDLETLSLQEDVLSYPIAHYDGETDGTIYAVDGIAPRAAVALKMDGSDVIMGYYSRFYCPDTLQQLFDDFDLRENLRFDYENIHYVVWENGKEYRKVSSLPDDSQIWKLFDDLDVPVRKFEKDDHVSLFATYVNIGIAVDKLDWSKDYSWALLQFSEEGCIFFNHLMHNGEFWLDPQKTKELYQYIRQFERDYVPSYDGTEFVGPE